MERWSTARRKWSDVLATSRSLLRLLSPSLLSAPLQGNDDNTAATKSLADFAQAQGRRREAEATLASIPFFSISLMHEMRGIPLSLRSSSSELTGLLRDDLISLLPPALVAAVNRQNADPAARTSPNKASEEEKRKQMANLNSPHIIQSLAHSNASSVNLALASLVLLQQHLDHFHESTVLSGPIYAHSIGLVNSLSLHMTELERVRDTPIPHAVSKHFLRLLTIHTVLLPVVVVQRLHSERWWMGMAIVGLVTSMLYGVDSFAARLGQPMGLDREDLPLEKYVADVQRQWAEVRDCCGTSK
nr:conserved hypothetical protein [Melanopsichium pennsylvanicum 4]